MSGIEAVLESIPIDALAKTLKGLIRDVKLAIAAAKAKAKETGEDVETPGEGGQKELSTAGGK